MKKNDRSINDNINKNKIIIIMLIRIIITIIEI